MHRTALHTTVQLQISIGLRLWNLISNLSTQRAAKGIKSPGSMLAINYVSFHLQQLKCKCLIHTNTHTTISQCLRLPYFSTLPFQLENLRLHWRKICPWSKSFLRYLNLLSKSKHDLVKAHTSSSSTAKECPESKRTSRLLSPQ